MTAKAQYDFAIIIPAFNEEFFLPETLNSVQESLKALPNKKSLLIVVDNNSDDKTFEIAKNFSNVTALKEPKQQISAARNKGGFYATKHTDNLIFLDADTLLNPDTLKQTFEALTNPNIIGGGALLSMNCHNLTSRIIINTWRLLSKSFKWAAGSYSFCHSSEFIKLNGFSKELYAAEDVDFSKRLKKLDKKKKFIIIQTPLETSNRKLEWYSTYELLQTLFPIAFNLKRLSR